MITIISFSSRKYGNCSSIADLLSQKLDNANVFSFSDFVISPCGRCAYQCFRSRESCPYFSDMEYQLLDTITHSDQAIFVVPNYCDYPNANFFAFNERSQCYFQGAPERLDQYLEVPKKFIVVSNSCSENFTEAFSQHTNLKPDILFLSAKQYGTVSTQGNILSCERCREDVCAFLER